MIPIAFYAPMKPPNHPNPSGDRRMARLFMVALEKAGFAPQLASSFRSYDGAGSDFAAIKTQALIEIECILAKAYREPASAPRLWFTYHLYHKAPDLIGPAIAQALAIPYIVAEASDNPRQAHGPWAQGYYAARTAMKYADKVFALTQRDAEGLNHAGIARNRLVMMRPFLDVAPFGHAQAKKTGHRKLWAHKLGLDEQACWILTVAMMRPGDKTLSYQALAAAIRKMAPASPWRLIIAGDGIARKDIEAFFHGLEQYVIFIGARLPDELPSLYAACDFYVWPGVNEAFGMTYLEAQASGLPVIAQEWGGIRTVIEEGCGMVLPRHDEDAFAQAMSHLVDDRDDRLKRGRRAQHHVNLHHDLLDAARFLREQIGPLVS